MINAPIYQILALLFLGIVLFCRHRINEANKALPPEQKSKLLDVHSSWVFLILLILIVGGFWLINNIYSYTQAKILSWSILLVAIFVLGISINIYKYQQLKALNFPKAYLTIIIKYTAIIVIAQIGFAFSLLLPFIITDNFSWLNKFNKISDNFSQTVPTEKLPNNAIKPLPYSCPSITELQNQLNSMKVGDTKIWHDKKNLTWTIEVPNSVVSPPTISGFYQANWSLSSYTLFCGYTSTGGNTAIFANGNFNVVEPDQAPWQKVDTGERICRGDPQNCSFDLLTKSQANPNK